TRTGKGEFRTPLCNPRSRSTKSAALPHYSAHPWPQAAFKFAPGKFVLASISSLQVGRDATYW
ncbi:hypothetical protein, partial [Atlantibacter hermannii]|uniref:hypothetical protein n=1 Tax=Atlantibacter hermannii TaxID=565 RepID=UPI0028ABFF56